MENKINK